MQTLSEFLDNEENQGVVLEKIIEALRERGEWGKYGLFSKISKRVGFSASYISKSLMKRKPLRENFVHSMAEYLDVSVQWLRGEHPERTVEQERLQHKFFRFPTEQAVKIARELFGDDGESEEKSQKLIEFIGWQGSEKVKKYYGLLHAFAKVPNEDVEAVTDALLLIKNLKTIKQHPATDE